MLDTWALIGWLKDQDPAARVMEDLWRKARAGQVRLVLHIINLGEVYSLTAKGKGLAAAEQVLDDLRLRRLYIWPVSDDMVLEAARLKARFSISYADAFAVLTAMLAEARLVTGDPELRPLERAGEVELDWIGS